MVADSVRCFNAATFFSLKTEKSCGLPSTCKKPIVNVPSCRAGSAEKSRD